MSDDTTPKLTRKAARRAFIERRNRDMEAKRKAALEAAPTKTKRMLQKRKAFASRVKEDLTVDLDKLKADAKRLSEKPERDITGRRGKNLFRAYPWIGMR